jgi:hypothetical protein
MKKIAYVIWIFGFVLIAFGIYKLMFSSNTPKTNLEYSGKYVNSNNSIYVYQDNKDSIYFILNSETYGRANNNNNKMSSSINGITYNFEFHDDTLNITSSNSKINGTYRKEKQLTIEEFYNLKFGEDEFLNSKYNGKYKKDDIEVNIYQSKESEVVGFIRNKNNTLLLRFTTDGENSLMCTLDDENYIISLQGESIIYIKEGSLEFIHEELPLSSNLTIKDILNLYLQN